MSSDIVARRYARAFFAVGKKKGLPELEKLKADLAVLREAILGSKELTQLYKSPLFTAENKASVTTALLTALKAGKSTQNFCRLLAEKGRLAYLPSIALVFGELLDAEKGIIRGELVTAVELSETKRKTVQEQLEKQVKHDLALSYSVDPSLLGGGTFKGRRPGVGCQPARAAFHPERTDQEG